jgi:hypothetical protein
MSDEERARILRMVSEGKLSPEEAADLLEALQSARDLEQPEMSLPPAPGYPGNPAVPQVPGWGRRARAVVIQVREGGESKVNIRVPISLTKAAGKFIPRQAQAHLAKYEINLTELLDDLAGSDRGTLLEVKDGENRVVIAVE